MNREILFRGKRVDNGAWVYGIPVEVEAECGIKKFIISHAKWDSDDNSIDFLETDVREVIPETVVQYTNLTDKNGRRIFEGDIVKNIDGIYVVEYCKSLTCFALVHDGLMSGRPVSSGTVIGNIHDDPEMMRGENNV